MVLALALGCRNTSRADVRFKPPVLGDGILVASALAEGFDSAQLSEAYQRAQRGPFRTARSLLVARNGRLVAEGYFNGADSVSRSDVRSVTKSVTALLTGVAIADGAIRGVQEPIADFVPTRLGRKADPRWQAITVEDLLTMRAGLLWDEWADGFADPNRMYQARNSIDFVLDHGLGTDPGRRFTYSTGTSQLLSAVLQRALGRRLDAYAEERFFRPLGISAALWQHHFDGTTYGGVGLQLTPRELMKVGLLVADEGTWHGRQIIPADWVREAIRAHVELPNGEGGYGHGWWIRAHGYAAEGYGGQYVYVVPSARVVVVFTADPYAAHHIDIGSFELLLCDILSALPDSGGQER